MGLKATYATWEEIPEEYRDLFEERGGEYKLTRIEGIVTQADVDRVQRSLNIEKEAHKKTKEYLEPYKNLGDPEEVQAKLDKYPELEAAAKGSEDVEAKAQEIAEAKLQSKLAPVERERDNLKNQLTEKEQAIEQFQTKERQRTIGDAVRKAATEAKVRDTALEDVLLHAERVFDLDDDGNVVTKDESGVTPGVGPDVFLQEMMDKRPHWWPESQGGGARGSGSGGGGVNNPFSAKNWNLTEQGRIVREQGQEKAEQMAKAAGTTLGGGPPQPAQ